jgi:hypothetical protein
MSFAQPSIQHPTRLNSDNEPSLVAGNGPYGRIAPDLDMDAIIQSFIREQQTMDPTQSYMTAQGGFESGSISSAGAMAHPMPAVAGGFNVGYAGPMWNTMNYQPDGSAEDMLFGFNGAGVDGMW